jgi:hypothetical protein
VNVSVFGHQVTALAYGGSLWVDFGLPQAFHLVAGLPVSGFHHLPKE